MFCMHSLHVAASPSKLPPSAEQYGKLEVSKDPFPIPTEASSSPQDSGTRHGPLIRYGLSSRNMHPINGLVPDFVASVVLYSQSTAYLKFARNEAWSFFSSVPKLLVCRHSRHSKVLRPDPSRKSTSLQEMLCPLLVNVWELSSTHLLEHGEFGVTSSADAEATSTRIIDAI